MNHYDMMALRTLFKCEYKVHSILNVFINGNIVVLLRKENPQFALIKGKNLIQPKTFIFHMARENNKVSDNVISMRNHITTISLLERMKTNRTLENDFELLDKGVESFHKAVLERKETFKEDVPMLYFDAVQKGVEEYKIKYASISKQKTEKGL